MNGFLKYNEIKIEYKNEEKNKLKFLFIPSLSKNIITRKIITTEKAKIKRFLKIFILIPLF
jgi:hypothetical protein